MSVVVQNTSGIRNRSEARIAFPEATVVRATCFGAVFSVVIVSSAFAQSIPMPSGIQCVPSPYGCPGDSAPSAPSSPTYHAPAYVRPHQPTAGELAHRQAVRINEQGLALSRRGDLRGALAKFRQAAAVDPSDPVIRNNVRQIASTIENEDGVALFSRSDFDAAIAKYRRALEINPSNMVARANLLHTIGVLASHRGDCIEAQKQYRAALKVSPSHKGAAGDLDRSTACATSQRNQLEATKRLEEQAAKERKYSQALNTGFGLQGQAFHGALRLDFAEAIKNIKLAIIQYQEALKHRPTDKNLQNLLDGAKDAQARYEIRQGLMNALGSVKSGPMSDAKIARLRALQQRDPDFVETKTLLAAALMDFKAFDPKLDTAGRIALLKEVAGLNLEGSSRIGASAITALAKRRLAALEAADAVHLPTSLMRVIPPPPEVKEWKTSFAEAVKSPAVAEITQKAIEQLDEAHRIAKEKIEDKAKETIEEKFKDKVVEIIPMSKAMKKTAVETAELIGRFKDLYGEMKSATNDYLLGWEKVTEETAACLSSATNMDCHKQAIKVETLTNDYNDKASKWGASWLREDLGARK